MGEIKSTMEKVMERLAQMDGATDKGELAHEEQEKEGMRLAAAFLRGELDSFAGRLESVSEQERRWLRRGAIKTLLRNIFLPREEAQVAQAEKAMAGLVELGSGDGELLMVCGELKKILEHYLQHRSQLKQQLVDQFESQVQMLEQNLAQQTGMSMKISPEQHPKFQEEWGRLTSELDSQYTRVLDQHKELLLRRLAG